MTIKHIKSIFIKTISADSNQEMNQLANKSYWPILCFFVFKRKIGGKDYVGLTIKDFADAGFTRATTYTTLKILSIPSEKFQILESEEQLLKKTIYRIKPGYGEEVAQHTWNLLEHITIRNNESMNDRVEKILISRTLEPEPDAIDVEQKEIERIEKENLRIIEQKKEIERMRIRREELEEEEKIRQKIEYESKLGLMRTENGTVINLNKIRLNSKGNPI